MTVAVCVHVRARAWLAAYASAARACARAVPLDRTRRSASPSDLPPPLPTHPHHRHHNPPPPPPKHPVHDSLWQAGLLLPLYLGIIAGFAEGADPLCRALDALPRAAALARDLALGVYLFQQPVMSFLAAIGWWDLTNPSGTFARGFAVELPLLAIAAAAVQYGVQQPLVRCYANGCRRSSARDDVKAPLAASARDDVKAPLAAQPQP